MKIPSAGLAKIPLLHKLVGGGAGAGMGILLIGRFFGWGAALVLLIGILVIVGLLYGLKMIVKWREKKKGEAFSDELSAGGGQVPLRDVSRLILTLLTQHPLLKL